MILFFQSSTKTVLAVEAAHAFSPEDTQKLVWLFSEATPVQSETLEGWYVGPRREMITPWSTNAVEITQNMGLTGISRIEEYFPVSSGDADHDPMLQRIYNGLNQEIFTISKKPDPIVYIEDLEVYNQQEGLALSQEEIAYLNEVSQKLGRKLTDSEVFGFSQVNSEHCRHKIFGGVFIIDSEEKESSLFNLIKKTSAENPNKLVSAYKDNVAFNEGPTVEQFAPLSGDKPDFFAVKDIKTVISLKAETHNFPTTVEPFNGAATGTGGEIRDRLGGLPNIYSSLISIGFTPSACSKTNFMSLVVSPTTYIGARSRSAIRFTRATSSSFINKPMRSWLSFPTISFAERVGSPIGNLLISMCPPVASTNSDKQLRCPPAPWSWIETIGFSSDSAIARITLAARFCISGLARCTAFNSIPLVYCPVFTEDTAPPPIPIR